MSASEIESLPSGSDQLSSSSSSNKKIAARYIAIGILVLVSSCSIYLAEREIKIGRHTAIISSALEPIEKELGFLKLLSNYSDVDESVRNGRVTTGLNPRKAGRINVRTTRNPFFSKVMDGDE